ncbi:MAG: PIG-L deacetylase family protein [Acidimicrobiales bacterium]
MGQLLTDTPATALAVFAHPDDADISCGGALAAWAARGCASHVVIVNQGDKGAAAPGVDAGRLAERRAGEAREAAAALGLAGVELLGYPDGEVENDLALRARLVAVIRRLRPEVVVAPDPTAVFFGSGYVNHHDHRAVGWAVLDACVPAAASPLYFPAAGEAHAVRELLLSGTLEADVWVDVAGALAAKVAAVQCHRSQVGEQAGLVGEFVRRRAAEMGAQAGVEYAEAYRRIALRG